MFLTCSSGPEQNRLRVLCFDATDGQLLWERQFWATGRTVCHEKTSVAAPTPCTDGKRLYAIFSSNDLVCLDFEGNLIWLRGITADYPNVSNSLGMSSSLVVTNGVVVAQVENDSESYAIGIDAMTGMNSWKIGREKLANWTSPVILNPALLNFSRSLELMQSMCQMARFCGGTTPVRARFLLVAAWGTYFLCRQRA